MGGVFVRQKTSFFLTFIMLFLSIGCSNTHIIKPDEPIHIKKYGTLFKKDLERIDISEFYSLGDSIIALHHNTNEFLEYSKSDVTKIVIWNRGKGAKQGVIAGALGASSLCYLLCPDNPGDALGSKEAGAFIWFFFGGFLGTPVGYVIGSNEVYTFITDNPEPMESKKESDNTDVDQTKAPAIVIAKDPDVDQAKPPEIVIVKDPEIEKIRVKEKMIAKSKKPPKAPSIYFVLRPGVGFGNMPTIKNSEESIINEKSGSGFGGSYQLWFPVKSNIYLGLSAGIIEFSQEDGGFRTTRSVDNFGLTTKMYPKKKNYYYEGAIGFSRFSQKIRITSEFSDLSNSPINGKYFSAGMGTSFIQGGKYELLLNGNVSFNSFEGGKRATLIRINLEIMFPRRKTI